MFVHLLLFGRIERPEPRCAVGKKGSPGKVGHMEKRECTKCINMWKGRKAPWKLYTQRNRNITQTLEAGHASCSLAKVFIRPTCFHLLHFWVELLHKLKSDKPNLICVLLFHI